MASHPTRPIRGSSRNLPAALKRADPPKPAKRELYLAIVVDHPKLYEHLREKVFVVGGLDDVEVKGFIVFNDPKHPMHQGDLNVRMALVQSGLVSPSDAGLDFPLPVQPGLPDRSTE